MARLKYWVWLSCISGVRPLAKYRLLESLDGPEAVFFADRDKLLSVEEVQPGEADRLMDKSMEQAADVLSDCEEKHISIVTLQDADYPERLRNIPDPPAVLYVWGRLPPVDERITIGVVGTRKATPYGVMAAAKFGSELTRGGAIVISGLALGCDSAAMEAALLAGGVTVGVLGTAIDVVYPAKNRRLFEDVKAHGALVSEYPPRARTYPADFRARNRIISGLSLGIVVVEAPMRSGTRNTVEHALDQNRDVFAIPGNVDAEASAGCNDLLAHGAIIAARGADVLAEYGARTDLFAQKSANIPIKKEIDKPKHIVYIDHTEPPKNLPSAQRKVLSVMTRPAMHADEIIEAAGMTAPETLAAITMLQVTGYIAQEAGKRYTRKL